MHNATPVKGELAGIAWLPEWQLPYEGAYTQLLKFAVANGTSAGELCEAVFGQRLNQAPSYGRLHARSLLDTHWIDQSGEKGIAAIRRLTIESSLGARAGRWTPLIAADKSFRYCPECLRHGFQSYLYQIDAVDRCPIHGVPILAHCQKCSQTTPPYALGEAGFGVPFHCPACLAPYSEESEMAQWGNHQLYAEAARRLSPLARWLQSLAASTLNWREWHAWDLPVRGLTNQKDKRRAALQVLITAIPPDLDLSCLDLGASKFKLYKGGFESVSSLVQRHEEISPEVCTERIQLYKAVRRRLAYATANCCTGTLAPMNWRIRIHNGDGAMVLSAEDCPRSQAFALWRYHFEEMLGNPHALELRKSSVRWPWNGVVDANAWVGYLLASFHAAVEAFDSWREAAVKLSDANVTGADRIRARELHAMYAPIVTPIRQPNFPAVSFLTFVNEKGMPAILVAGPTKCGSLERPEAGRLTRSCQQRGQPRPKQAMPAPAVTPVDTIAAEEVPERPLVRREYFWPLDLIRLPPSLDGSELQVRLRASGPAMVKARNDLEAIQLWIDHYPNEKTRKDHVIQVQKVLLWCVAQRNIALSAMTTADVDAFTEFLVTPEPRDIWLPTKLRGKARPWSPMRALPSPATQRSVLTVIAVMFKCWSAWAYIRDNPFDNSKFAQRQAQKILIEGPGVPQPTGKFLSIAEWRYLIDAVPEHTAIPLPAVRFILYMAYYGALKPSEIGCITLGDLHLNQGSHGELDIWSVRINSRPPGHEVVFMLAPVAQLIAGAIPAKRSLVARYLQSNRDNWLRHLFGIEYAGISADDPALMGSRLGVALKPVFQAAAELALEAGDEMACQRLKQATLIWVSASLWHHVPASFVAGTILWEVLGTARHIPPEERYYLPLREPFDLKLVREQMASLQKVIAR